MRPCKVQIHVNLFLSKDSAPLLASAAARPRDEPLTGTLTKETSPYLYCVPANAGDEPHLQKLSFSPKYTSRRERDRRPAAQPSRAKAGLPPSSRASSAGDAAAALAPPRTASRSCAWKCGRLALACLLLSFRTPLVYAFCVCVNVHRYLYLPIQAHTQIHTLMGKLIEK